MNGIITRGYGKSKTIITRGYGGFFEKVIEEVRNIVRVGGSKARELKELVEYGTITITAHLISINDRSVDKNVKGVIQVTYRKIFNKISLVTEHIKTKINRDVSGILIHVNRVWRKK